MNKSDQLTLKSMRKERDQAKAGAAAMANWIIELQALIVDGLEITFHKGSQSFAYIHPCHFHHRNEITHGFDGLEALVNHRKKVMAGSGCAESGGETPRPALIIPNGIKIFMALLLFLSAGRAHADTRDRDWTRPWIEPRAELNLVERVVTGCVDTPIQIFRPHVLEWISNPDRPPQIISIEIECPHDPGVSERHVRPGFEYLEDE